MTFLEREREKSIDILERTLLMANHLSYNESPYIPGRKHSGSYFLRKLEYKSLRSCMGYLNMESINKKNVAKVGLKMREI